MLPDLAETQARFGAALRGDDDALKDLLCPHRGGLAPAVPLTIHRNNVQSSVGQSLAGLYPALVAFVGEVFFARLVVDFHRDFPPLHGHLVDYGDRLGDFLRDYAPLTDYPWLVDVARIESAGFEVYKAPELKPLDPATLAGVTPEKASLLHFHFVPCARLIASLYPVLSLYRYAMAGGDGDETPSLTRHTDCQNLLVLRRDEATEFILLDSARFIFLQSLQSGAALAEAIAAGLASSQHFVPEEALKFAFSCGLFVAGEYASGHDCSANPLNNINRG